MNEQRDDPRGEDMYTLGVLGAILRDCTQGDFNGEFAALVKKDTAAIVRHDSVENGENFVTFDYPESVWQAAVAYAEKQFIAEAKA